MHSSATVASRNARSVAPKITVLVTAALVRFVAWLERQRRIRRDTAALMAMDDHLLTDVAVARAQIGRAVRHGRPPASAEMLHPVPPPAPAVPVMLLNLGTAVPPK